MVRCARARVGGERHEPARQRVQFAERGPPRVRRGHAHVVERPEHCLEERRDCEFEQLARRDACRPLEIRKEGRHASCPTELRPASAMNTSPLSARPGAPVTSRCGRSAETARPRPLAPTRSWLPPRRSDRRVLSGRNVFESQWRSRFR